MAKISPVSAKYIVHAAIEIDGVVDKPDVIGAIFGQTEGLLGSDLELRELQRSGRIGRIEVDTDTKGGKTGGKIIIPSSLDKAETAIIAAALEIIQRIGPCNAKVKVDNIEDVRVSKRNFVIERAKELLRNLTESVLPDSQELADEVAYSVRVMEIQEYGKDRLPAGPAVDESDEVVVVEGRADVLNLLKHGIKNAIALNGTNIPDTIVELSRKKVIIMFVDGDRGGDLIIRGLMNVADVDYVAKAPDGKEVEEITKKEIHKALRNKVAAEQVRLEGGKEQVNKEPDRNYEGKAPLQQQRPQQMQPRYPFKKPVLSLEEKKSFGSMLEDLIGTKAAYILDSKLNILGKVPLTELVTTLRSFTSGVHAIVFDGIIDRDHIGIAEKLRVRYLVGMDTKIKPSGMIKTNILTINDL